MDSATTNNGVATRFINLSLPQCLDQVGLSAEIGETEIPSQIRVRQLRVLQTEQSQDRSVQIVKVHGIAHSAQAQLIRRSNNPSALHPASGHPDRKAVRIMIPSIGSTWTSVGRGAPAEFPAPNDQR